MLRSIRSIVGVCASTAHAQSACTAARGLTLVRSTHGVAKRSTGIVGLDVVPDAREVLVKLYEKTLNDLQIMPASVPYRQDMEKLAKYRMGVVQANENVRARPRAAVGPATHGRLAQVAEIEAIIGVGQIEELIEHAKGELTLIPMYASWKAWERSPPVPSDDSYDELYDTLEYIDPDSVERMGLKSVALKKRAEVELRQRTAAAAAAAAATAAAPKA